MLDTDIFLGLGWGAEATDVTGLTAEVGGVLAGAAVFTLSSSSVISTLRVCKRRVHTWMQQVEHMRNWSDYLFWFYYFTVGYFGEVIYLFATNGGLLTSGVSLSSCWDLKFLKYRLKNASLNAQLFFFIVQ